MHAIILYMDFSVSNPMNTQISFDTETPLDVHLPGPLVSGGLLFFVGIVGVFSLVMIYHWFTYGRNKVLSAGTTVVYLGGVLFFIGMIIQIFTSLAQ